MEAHAKYLDELIGAIKEFRLTSFDSTSVAQNNSITNLPIQRSLDEDPKSLKVLSTLLANLKDSHKRKYLRNDSIFGKTIQALDLLLSSRPFLLVADIPTSSTNEETILGIKRIINNILQVTINNYNNAHRIWFLKKKLGKWCKLLVNLYKIEFKYKMSEHILTLVSNTEQDISQVLTGTHPTEKFVGNLKKLYVLCYWLCSSNDIFGNSISILDSSMGFTKWTFMFEKIIRFLMYIFASIRVSHQEYPLLQLKFISLMSDFLICESRSQGGISLNRFKFTVETISHFLKSSFGVLPLNDILAKSMMKVYSLCIDEELNPNGSNKTELLDIFIHSFAFEKGIDFARLLYSENYPELPYNLMTVVAILLTHFDSSRRTRGSSTELTFNDKYRVWTLPEDNERLLDIISKPLPEEFKQLEKLRYMILYSFHFKTKFGLLKYEIDTLDPGLLNRVGDNMDALYEDIGRGIQLCINTKATSRLISWTRVLGRLSCFQTHSQNHMKLTSYENCELCDGNNLQVSPTEINPERPDISKCKAFDILNRLFICNPLVDDFSEGLLCGILFSLQRMFTHFQPPNLYNTTEDVSSGFFDLLKKCFSNHSRYLRLTSVRIIPLLNITYIHNKNDENTMVLVKLLQSVTDPITTETVVMSWIKLIQTTRGELFDTLLLKLMDIFNSDDYTVHSMMTFQIQNLAKTLGKTPYQLLSPILPILLQQLGKNLMHRKASFQRLCDLLGYSGKTILEMFQRYIVPYAIMNYQNDSFGEIARIMCDGEVEYLNQQQHELLEFNSRQIFAVALVKNSIFSLESLEQLFINRSPDFDKHYVTRYLPDFRTLAEITKLYKYNDKPDANDKANEEHIIQALRFLITDFEKDKRKGKMYMDEKKWNEDREKIFKKKLEELILGIFQVYSGDIHNVEGKTTYYEKLRVVNGILLLIKIASKNAIISALAQISICLQTTLEIEEVRYSAFKAWQNLVERLNDEELSTVIDGFVSFILQKWTTFDRSLQALIYQILNNIFEKKPKLFTDSKLYIAYALLQKSELKLADRSPIFARLVKKKREISNYIPIFSENLKSNNRYVILQNLEDIETFLRASQNKRVEDLFQKQNHEQDIGRLLGALLDTSHRFRSIDKSLCEKCTKCISMIGVLDVTKHSLNDPTIKHNVYFFNDHIQVVRFLIWIINDVLVPAFWQSENPRKQLFFALVMQESLRFCGLDSESWNINRPDDYPLEKKLWDQFNTISQTTLYPLMSSLYLAQSWKEYTPLQYPTFRAKESYKTWIRTLTLDLLKMGTVERSPLHVFSSLIREDDGYLSNLLLPYIVVDIILNAETKPKYTELVENIVQEFRFIFDYDTDNLNAPQMDTLKMAYESIFKVFEYGKKWTTSYRKDYYEKHGTNKITDTSVLRQLKRLDTFLTTISPDILAQRSLLTSSYERSVLYLEECYRSTETGKPHGKDLINDLQNMYEKIEDVDSIDGMLKTFTSTNLESKIKELQYSSNWKMAQDCFAVLGDFKLDSPSTTKMLRSMQEHQLEFQVINSTNLMLPNNLLTLDDDKSEWYHMGLEAANTLGDINVLKNWINKVESLQITPDHNVLLQYNIAKALHCVYSGEINKIPNYVNKCFRLVGTYFTIFASTTTLAKQQDILMKLHGLYDLLLLSSETSKLQYDNNIETIKYRLNRVGADFKSNYYLMALRKSYDLFRNTDYTDKDLGQVYFKIAQLSRDNSRLDIASDSLMKCLPFNHPQAELEFAEILWKKGENDRALKLVREIHQRNRDQPNVDARSAATVLLKYTEWLDLSNNSSSSRVIKQYQEILRLDSQWDEPYYSFGLYFSRLLERKKEEGYITTGLFEFRSITYFLQAFELNPSKVRENLPKVVTFWLNITSDAAEPIDLESDLKKLKPEVSRDRLKSADLICDAISEALERCPTYIWYSVLTQLLSRLLHPFPKSAKLIEQIILKLSIGFPHHILWYIATLLNSKTETRRDIGKKIVKKVKSLRSHERLMDSAELLTKQFTKVCVADMNNVSSDARNLVTDFKFKLNIAPTALAVPVRTNLEMVSPAVLLGSKKTYVPFRDVVSIAGFHNKYKVFSSLKRPKQITIIGSDGLAYGIMCKEEDVRQDNQYMQFATTMDFLLKKDVESRKRQLGITTYSVLSLREDCGLIEIVPNVITIRSILINKYGSPKYDLNLRRDFKYWSKKLNTKEERRQFYDEKKELYDPKLYTWFLETFPDPINWFNARNRYTRSYAVMAMVGHILGLGDRHCENILLDIETGNILHVDFDCLFEKGKTLPTPEIVPFRLTQNITDAFGIIGTEGTFKKSSEVTLTLVRRNEVSLVNVIETIMYDREVDDSLGDSLKLLRNKVRGIDSRDGLVLSVPGQVDTLIQESTSDDNLGAMFIGWMPYW
ncbi:serine/threonine-protein kinase Mec1p [Monosporozyma unispora]